MDEQVVYTKDIDFIPVIFFQETLNSERKYGRLTRWTRVDDYTAVLYFEPLGGTVPEPVVVRYFDSFDWEVCALGRFMIRELGKENVIK